MSTPSRRLQNAPLVEVIAEMRWQLPISAMGQPIDSDWFELEPAVFQALSAAYPERERLQPVGLALPLDMAGEMPLVRYRRSAGGWPVVQLGQGLLTFNVTPPYDGWDVNVRAALGAVMDALATAVPLMRTRQLRGISLTYQDAFRARHGVSDPQTFLQGLNGSSLAAALRNATGGDVSAQVDYQLRLPGEGAARVQCLEGMYNAQEPGQSTEPAAIVNFAVNLPVKGPISPDVLKVFDKAHDVASSLFAAVVPPEIMERLR